MTDNARQDVVFKIYCGLIIISTLIGIFGNYLSWLNWIPILTTISCIPVILTAEWAIKSENTIDFVGNSMLGLCSLAVIFFALNRYADFSDPTFYPAKIRHYNRGARSAPASLITDVYLPNGRTMDISLHRWDLDSPIQVGEWGQVGVYRGLFGIPYWKGFRQGPGPNDHLRPKETLEQAKP